MISYLVITVTEYIPKLTSFSNKWLKILRILGKDCIISGIWKQRDWRKSGLKFKATNAGWQGEWYDLVEIRVSFWGKFRTPEGENEMTSLKVGFVEENFAHSTAAKMLTTVRYVIYKRRRLLKFKKWENLTNYTTTDLFILSNIMLFWMLWWNIPQKKSKKYFMSIKFDGPLVFMW